ncbi:hypothetical protein BDP27DRAFT_81613 [Rhodocollybia butyracea]|uniref:Uncharacterized protein n=1 Tax=Rhodocollybia butyracea TaxID=206335 RepID=A0A9P5PKR6_9AGAR|nr:hypothetical protein BDP27DRAFT_81613 [Rhodocollybia butyracea]
MDLSQLPIVFSKDQPDLQSPRSQTDAVGAGDGTPSDPASLTNPLTMEHTPFVVTDNMSKNYYKGLPSSPRLVASTHPSPAEPPSDLAASSVLKEIRVLRDHPLISVWDNGLAVGISLDLNMIGVNWTSLEALTIAKVGEESSGPATVWIGVESGALSYEEGSNVAHSILKYIVDQWHIPDCRVEIRESRVMRQTGNNLPNPVTSKSPTMELTPFVVIDDISESYYKGLPSNPCLIATTHPSTIDPPSGGQMEDQWGWEDRWWPDSGHSAVLKEIRALGDHSLASVWDKGLATSICEGLNTMHVNWTSLDALTIAKVGDESSGLATVWIGVEFGALSYEEGSNVAHRILQGIIGQWHIEDCRVEIRESRVMRQIGNKFLNLVHFNHATFTIRSPYTATLGSPISTKDRLWDEGTGGFYFSAGGNDSNIYLVTARHVVLPLGQDDNEEYEQPDDNKLRVVIHGTTSFDENLAAFDREIKEKEFVIKDIQDRIRLMKDKNDFVWVEARILEEKNLQMAKTELEQLNLLLKDIATHWEGAENRVFGELVWAPPIIPSTEPGRYTLDLAVIKIDPGMLDAENFLGNTVNLGKKYTPLELAQKVHLHSSSSPSFKIPGNRLVKLEDQVPEDALFNPPMRDADSKPCFIVFKNGGKTGMTFGKANNVSSFTRTCLAGQYRESKEWPVIATNQESGAFSAKGDSGSCVADIFGRVAGILTSGSGATESADVTYVTPISFIMQVLTKRFPQAHLSPTLVVPAGEGTSAT